MEGMNEKDMLCQTPPPPPYPLPLLAGCALPTPASPSLRSPSLPFLVVLGGQSTAVGDRLTADLQSVVGQPFRPIALLRLIVAA